MHRPAGTLVLAVIVAVACAPATAHGDVLKWPQNDWDVFIGDPCNDEVMTLWSIDVDDPQFLDCGTCTASTTPEAMTLAPGHLIVGAGGNYIGAEWVEVDVIEHDPALSVTIVVHSVGSVVSLTAYALGPNTLRLPSHSFGIDIDCCDCEVREIRWLGERIVPIQGRGWTSLKSRFR